VKAVYALYPDPAAAQTAFDNLVAAGVDQRAITVISSEPFEEYAFSHRDRQTWMFWIAGAGGVLGLLFGAWLTSMTERDWPLQTGGMPIVAWWPNLIIIFELTMLFAVLATVITLLVTAGLPGRVRGLYDPAVSDGRILVGVENPKVPTSALESALAVGPGEVKTIS
jgi:hypothetical protein